MSKYIKRFMMILASVAIILLAGWLAYNAGFWLGEASTATTK